MASVALGTCAPTGGGPGVSAVFEVGWPWVRVSSGQSSLPLLSLRIIVPHHSQVRPSLGGGLPCHSFLLWNV